LSRLLRLAQFTDKYWAQLTKPVKPWTVSQPPSAPRQMAAE